MRNSSTLPSWNFTVYTSQKTFSHCISYLSITTLFVSTQTLKLFVHTKYILWILWTNNKSKLMIKGHSKSQKYLMFFKLIKLRSFGLMKNCWHCHLLTNFALIQSSRLDFLFFFRIHKLASDFNE